MIFNWLALLAQYVPFNYAGSDPVTDRPGFTHRRERRGLIGPFGGRQLLGGRDRDRRGGRDPGRRDDAARDRRARSGRAIRRPTQFVARPGADERPQAGDIPPELDVTGARTAAGRPDRPRRPAGPARRPPRQGRLDQLLGVVVPALPVRDAGPSRHRRRATGIAASSSSGSASRRRARPTSPPTPRSTSSATRSRPT